MKREWLVEEVNENTEALRGDEDIYFTQLREMLREKGIDPEEALLASFLEDEEENEYGLIVCGRNGVFEYERSREKGAPRAFTTWTKLTDLTEAAREYPQLEVALELLAQKTRTQS